MKVSLPLPIAWWSLVSECLEQSWSNSPLDCGYIFHIPFSTFHFLTLTLSNAFKGELPF